MKKILAIWAILVVSACASAPSETILPDLTFDNVQPIFIPAGQVEVVEKYKSPMADPYVEHLFKTSPAESLKTLFNKQLTAQGGENILRVTIEDASIVSEKLPVTEGWRDMFQRDASEKLKAQVVLKFELIDPAHPEDAVGYADLAADRTKFVLEDASLAERDLIYFHLIEDVMKDVSSGMESIVNKVFEK